MNSETKILATIFGMAVFLLIGGVIYLSKTSSNNGSEQLISDKQFNIDYSLGQKIGSDSAKLKLVEFSDFQCPFCAQVYPYVKEVLKTNGANIQFIYRNFPLEQHKNSRKAALAALAAAEDGKYWEMHDKIFDTQGKWQDLPDPTEFFMSLAKDAGADPEKIKAAIEKETYKDAIDKDLSDGRAFEVNSTPTFYLNGRKLQLQGFSDLQKAIDQELKR